MSESVSLRLWREVGRHDDLQSALDAAVALVRDDLALRVAAIRYLIAEHHLWETVAVTGGPSHATLVGSDPVGKGGATILPDELSGSGRCWSTRRNLLAAIRVSCPTPRAACSCSPFFRASRTSRACC